jgi:hypothetical protein
MAMNSSCSSGVKDFSPRPYESESSCIPTT